VVLIAQAARGRTARGRAARHGGPGQEQVEVEVLSRRFGAAVILVAGAVLVYFGFLRDWHLHWGATAQEAGGEVADDELMPDPDIVATRAVEIDAPPSAVWPWLVQMGPGRGGAYTYDWIERRLGVDIHNSDRIIPEFQHLQVGPRSARVSWASSPFCGCTSGGRVVMHTGVAPAVWWQKRSANAAHRSCRGKDPGTRDRNRIVARVKIL
jgi:hypothetical protein